MSAYDIVPSFNKVFNAQPEVLIKSPGRVNIIGEHTDYNDGFVLPAAINYYMHFGLAKNDSDQINLYSADYNTSVSISLSDISRGENDWLNLISGVVFQLKDKIGGFELAFGGDIPEGAGVSSSAALCCGVAMGVSELFGLGLEKWEMAKIAQKSEHDFSLVQCGIMDQFACLFGLPNHVLLLNCESLEYEETPVHLSGAKFLLINSNVKHSLGDSPYNQRRHESAQGLLSVKSKYPHVNTYQDVTREMVDVCEENLDPVVWKRTLHVVTENQRVMIMKDAMSGNDHQEVGKILKEGHDSLKRNYEVTCPETDFLVDQLVDDPAVFGARQVGGGFGGCVLALVKEASPEVLLSKLQSAYHTKFGLSLNNIPIELSKGCHRIA